MWKKSNLLLVPLWIVSMSFLSAGTSRQGVPEKGQQAQATAAPLTNKDILSMVRMGLAPEKIVEKIKASASNFDTSPAGMQELQTAGVPDSVIQAMTNSRVGTPNGQPPGPAPPTPASEPGKTIEVSTSVLAPKGFVISYVKSDQKWQLGFRHEPFDKISQYVQDRLIEALESKGIKKVETLQGTCCQLSIELLQVSTRQAVIKKPGIDVAANIAVTDANNKLVYSKGYKGRSGTAFMNTFGHLINHACEDMAKNMSADENLLKVLTTGEL